MKVYEMTIADIASEIFDKGEDFAEKIFNDIDELEKNKLLEINKLKQQLAEKDKEIEEKMMSFEKRCQEYYKSDEFKRDFAIQELEKVIDYIKEHRHTAQDDRYIVYVKSLKDQINKQIKELKGK